MVQSYPRMWSELRNKAPSRLVYIIGAVLVTIVVVASLRQSTSLFPKQPVGHESTSYVNSFPNSWHFDTDRDANNYGLTSDQCDIAFPALFKEIDQVVGRRRSKPITKAELAREKWPAGTIRVLVWEQQIYILETWEHTLRKSRVYTTLHSLNRALMASTDEQKLPNIEFIFSIEDWSIADDLPIWAYDRRGHDTNTWLMPDFGFYAWPEPGVGTYSEVRRRMRDVEETMPFADKIPKLVWRGAVTPSVAPTLRQNLLDQTVNQTWADVQVLDWKAQDDSKRNRINIEDHCKYQFIQHTAGRAWSGRLKYVQNCESVIVSHDLEWIQHHQHLLEPSGESQNYVLVRRDFADLPGKMEYLTTHPEEAERIARNSARTFRDRYITPAAEACYWRKLVRGWGEVAWEPEFYKDTGAPKARNWRGVPFESFAIMRTLEWEVT